MSDNEKKSLTVLLDERRQIAAQLAESDNPEELIEKIDWAIEVKAAGIALYLDIVERMIEGVDSSIKQLQERKKVLQNRKERLREYTLNALQGNGIKKIECPECTISVNPTAPKTVIDDERMIPIEYWKQREPVLDLARVRQELKEGVIIQGAHLEPQEALFIK